MQYRLMRMRKYLDSLRTNKPFFKTSLKQKYKISNNIIEFFRASMFKPLVLKNKPVTAQIEPTSECNLRCEMCIRDKIGVPIGTMKFEDFKKILDKLDSLFKVHLSGQGEPLLNKDFFKMVEYANKRGILVNTNTNAVLLTPNIIKKICKVEIGEIGVSIDSTKKEKYEEIRKGSKFEMVIENVKKLNYVLKKKNKRTVVVLAVVIMKDNLNEIVDFINLARKTGINKIVFQTMQVKEDYLRNYNSKNRKRVVNKFIKELKNKIEKVKEVGKKYKINVIFDEGKGRGCIWPWRGIYITWNGYVTVCCKILDYKNPLMGNLLEQNFWEVWNSKKYQMFRKLLKERKSPIVCRGCASV